MIIGGTFYGATKGFVQLFNTQSGHSCYLQDLPHDTVFATGGIFEGFPAFCGGHTYYLPHLDTCYKYNQSWIPVRNCPNYDMHII